MTGNNFPASAALAVVCAAIAMAAFAALAMSDEAPEPQEQAALLADMPAPGGESGWVPLDLSRHMNRDVIQTPNEWLRCLQIYQDVVQSSDDPARAVQPLRLTVNNVFGDHSLARWSSLSYHVRGRFPRLTRDDENELQIAFFDQEQGLPQDGRIGPFRLYMDELESPDWPRGMAGGGRLSGRNAVRFGRWRQDSQVMLDLAAGERKRYRALNLLFAAENHGCENYVRLSAEYDDGHRQLLYEGALMDYSGRETWNGDRREYEQPEGQVEYFRYLSKASGYQSPSFTSGYGYACLNTFERPLRLDGQRVLKALHIETLYEIDEKIVSGESWGIVIMAAIALPN